MELNEEILNEEPAVNSVEDKKIKIKNKIHLLEKKINKKIKKLQKAGVEATKLTGVEGIIDIKVKFNDGKIKLIFSDEIDEDVKNFDMDINDFFEKF